MYLKADTLDDLMHRVLKLLLATKGRSVASSRGANYERTGVLLSLVNARARLSRTTRRSQLFSCLGEFAWYMSKSKSLDFISYYVPKYVKESSDGKTIPDAYGPRLFKHHGQNQIANVIALLKERESTRRAVVQIFDAEDIPSGHVPCTCTLQFMVRGKRLHAFANMRSNDAYLGLPHDVFAFTMLQELVAREIGVELGGYKHSVGSLHLYQKHVTAAEDYVDDGFHQTLAMPAMPLGNQSNALKQFLRIESDIRNKKHVDLERVELEPYWLDLARLLRIFRFFKDNDRRGMDRHLRKLTNDFYVPYVEVKKRGMEDEAVEVPQQQPLFADGNNRK